MKILIINLERATDRREAIDKQLNELGLEHQFVPAIDYTLVEEDYINSLRTPFKQRFYWLKDLTKGEMACTLSHRKAWQALVESNEDWALILEDDVQINPELANLIKDNSWIPSGINLVLSSKSDGRVGDYCSVSLPILSSPSKDIQFGKIYDNTKTTGGSSGYFINRLAAQALILASNTVHMPADDFIFKKVSPARENCDAYAMSRAIAIHPAENKSYLKKEKAVVKTPILKSPVKYLQRSLYKVKHKIGTALFSKKLPIS